jgi:exodeoxyribonuclease VIII
MEAFERVIALRRYHVRAAYYLDNCNLMNLDKSHYFFICVEKEPPYAVRCLQLNGDVIEFGRKVYSADLQTYRNCLETDTWPGWSQSYDEIALPSWQMKQIYELIG